MGNKIIYILCFLAAIIYSCKKLYNPTLSTTNLNNLVVEGFIDTGTDSTIIKLSRTVIVANKTAANPETKATVTVENAQGITYAIAETAVKGIYAVRSLNLDNTKQYRLRIKTTGGKTYLSDLVTPKVTPAIDSIGYLIKNNGISLYANTHDNTNTTRYYRYSYRETWQFHAAYYAAYIFSYQDTSLHQRTAAQQIYSCFGTDTSAHTILNSTAALANDVAFQVPITVVDGTSEKISAKYSILVSQQALTKEAYNFYQSLQKNTENLGSIFDAQPSQLVGNIHNVADASEPVIGYIMAGTTQKKRIYLLKTDLPRNFQVPLNLNCAVDTAIHYASHNITIPDNPQCKGCVYVEEQLYPNVNAKLVSGEARSLALSPLTAGNKIYGYLFTSQECANCTLRGTTQQPPFWK